MASLSTNPFDFARSLSINSPASWAHPKDNLTLDDMKEDNPTISDCIENGSVETLKQLCDINEYEIVFVKKANSKNSDVDDNESPLEHLLRITGV